MAKKFKRQMLLAGILVLILTCIPVIALAHDTDASRQTTTAEERRQKANELKSETSQDRRKAAKERVERRLQGQRLQRCERRSATIGRIMARIVDRSNKQIKLFDTIATRAEAFYTEKGETLSNYNDLVGAVDAAKAQAENDLQELKVHGSFACDSSDPIGHAAAFRAAVKTEVADLKEYRTAVKNLIVGVKSVQGTSSSNREGTQ